MMEITRSKYSLKYRYFLDEQGNIYSQKSGKKISTHLDKDGYEKVRFVCSDNKRHTFSVHRLMLENFCPRNDMEELQVNHIDGDKLNNCLSNLEWCTCKENIDHAIRHHLCANQKGEYNNSAKLSEAQVLQIIKMLQSKKFSGAEIDRYFGLCKDYSNSIRRKERWNYLTQDIDFD